MVSLLFREVHLLEFNKVTAFYEFLVEVQPLRYHNAGKWDIPIQLKILA
jgi:hypothetical protein